MAVSLLSQRVDASDDFGHSGDVLCDQINCFCTQRTHALSFRQSPQFVLRSPSHDESLYFRCHSQKLVDPDSLLVPGPAAEVAPLAAHKFPFFRTAALLIERPLRVRE